LHCWPETQAAHVRPPAPQEAFDSLASGSHEPVPVQHPAQAPPPHEQLPFEQESPVAQVLHAAPPVPHSELDCDV
jgi:hypothetical protein